MSVKMVTCVCGSNSVKQFIHAQLTPVSLMVLFSVTTFKKGLALSLLNRPAIVQFWAKGKHFSQAMWLFMFASCAAELSVPSTSSSHIRKFTTMLRTTLVHTAASHIRRREISSDILEFIPVRSRSAVLCAVKHSEVKGR